MISLYATGPDGPGEDRTPWHVRRAYAALDAIADAQADALARIEAELNKLVEVVDRYEGVRECDRRHAVACLKEVVEDMLADSLRRVERDL